MALRSGIAVLFGAALLVACEPAAMDDLAEEAERLEARVETLERENTALQEEITRLLDDGQDQGATTQEPVEAPTPQPLPPNTVEGIADALRAYLPDQRDVWVPGVTGWRDADLELPAELTDPAGAVASHGELTLRLVDAVVDADQFGGPPNPEFSFPWEVTARVLRTSDDEAMAIVQQWGTGDDSVSGTDYLFTLRRNSAGWYVAGVAERNQCTRNERLPGEDDLPELCV